MKTRKRTERSHMKEKDNFSLTGKLRGNVSVTMEMSERCIVAFVPNISRTRSQSQARPNKLHEKTDEHLLCEDRYNADNNPGLSRP